METHLSQNYAATDTQRDANIRNLMLLPNILWHYLCIWCFCYGVSPWVFFKVTWNWMFLLWSTSTFNGKSKKEKKKKVISSIFGDYHYYQGNVFNFSKKKGNAFNNGIEWN